MVAVGELKSKENKFFKKNLISECGEMRPMSRYQAIASSINETVTSTHLANTTFFIIIITSVLISEREVGPAFGQSILEFLLYFFFFVWVERDGGGRETTPIVTLHPTAVDFLKRHSVLLWVQSSAPPLASFMQPSNHVKHL